MAGLVTFNTGTDFKKTFKFLESIRERRIFTILDDYGKKGVSVLQAATPKRTGLTADSWSYRVIMEPNSVGIEWMNSNMAGDGRTPVAILIQMGHGTRNGGYVQPNDYINPAMNPLFDEITEKVSEVVRSL